MGGGGVRVHVQQNVADHVSVWWFASVCMSWGAGWGGM